MIRLQKSLVAWGTPDFEAVIRQELAGLGIEQLPLQQGLGGSSYATDRPPQVMIISSSESQRGIRIKAGIFYSGIIAGCSCADDPTPVEEQAEYCVVHVDIDKTTGEATIALAEDE
ncbi:MAG: hypothetical protein WBQ78_10475 [Gammaproteobacteria bacterium]